MAVEPRQIVETLDQKRFTLKGATLLTLVGGLIGVVVSSMTVYAEIDRRITENERNARVQAERLEEVADEVKIYRQIDPRLRSIETDVQWIKRALGGGREQ